MLHDGALHGASHSRVAQLLHEGMRCTRACVAQASLHGERRRVRLCSGYCRACVLHKSVSHKGGCATTGTAGGSLGTTPLHKCCTMARLQNARCTWACGTRCALHKSSSCRSCALHEGSRCTRGAVAQSQAACIARGEAVSHEGSFWLRAPQGGCASHKSSPCTRASHEAA